MNATVHNIYGYKVTEHSRYKGATIYKTMAIAKWFAAYTDISGYVKIIESGSLADLKIEINYLNEKGVVKR